MRLRRLTINTNKEVKLTLKKGDINIDLDPSKYHRNRSPRQSGYHILNNGKRIGLFIHKPRSYTELVKYTVTHTKSERCTTMFSDSKLEILAAVKKCLLEIDWTKEFDYKSEYYREKVALAISAANLILAEPPRN